MSGIKAILPAIPKLALQRNKITERKQGKGKSSIMYKVRKKTSNFVSLKEMNRVTYQNYWSETEYV